MRNFCAFLALSAVLAACQGGGEAGPDPGPQQAVADTIPLPDPLPLSAPVRQAVREWTEFNTLEDRMGAVYSANGPEEMGLVLEELRENLKSMEDSAYPGLFDAPSVKSREKVISTYLLKTQAALHYRTDYRPPLRQFLEAYNAFREQLNRVEASQLDPTLFEDE